MKSSYLRALNMASFFVANKVIVFIALSAYVLAGNKMAASTVFVALSLYGAVRLTITLFFPSAIEKVSETLISVRRIRVNMSFVCPLGRVCSLGSLVGARGFERGYGLRYYSHLSFNGSQSPGHTHIHTLIHSHTHHPFIHTFTRSPVRTHIHRHNHTFIHTITH